VWVLEVVLWALTVAGAGTSLPVVGLVVEALKLLALIIDPNALASFLVNVHTAIASNQCALISVNALTSLLIKHQAQEVWALERAPEGVLHARAGLVVEGAAWGTADMNVAVEVIVIDFMALEGLTLAGHRVEDLAAAALTIAPLKW